MPTETFFNLPAAKREKLNAAIREELARAPFAEMSINRIVQAAGISRGSYYQYFTDREDLFSYLVSDYKRLLLQAAKQALAEAAGDVFAATRSLFTETSSYVRYREQRQTVIHLFNEVRARADFIGCADEGGTDGSVTRSLLPLLDAAALRAETDEERTEMLLTLFGVYGRAVLDVIETGDAKRAEEKLVWRLDVLKNGMGRSRA